MISQTKEGQEWTPVEPQN